MFIGGASEPGNAFLISEFAKLGSLDKYLANNVLSSFFIFFLLGPFELKNFSHFPPICISIHRKPEFLFLREFNSQLKQPKEWPFFTTTTESIVI
jgi:hypothetical protein